MAYVARSRAPHRVQFLIVAHIVWHAIMMNVVTCSSVRCEEERPVDKKNEGPDAESGVWEGVRGDGFPFWNNLTRHEPVRIAVTMPITSRCVCLCVCV